MQTLVLLCCLVHVLAQRSYTINSVSSTILVKECSAIVTEDFELFFNGLYSNFYRAIQDYTTSTQRQAQISNYGVIAQTSNVQVVGTTIQRPNNVASRINVQFSSSLSDLGLTRFRFIYTINNFVGVNSDTKENYFTWNTKWQMPVGVVNTTINFSTAQDSSTLTVTSTQSVPILKSDSQVHLHFIANIKIFVPYTNLPSALDYDLRVGMPIQPQLQCLSPIPEPTSNPATSAGAIVGYAIGGVVVICFVTLLAYLFYAVGWHKNGCNCFKRETVKTVTVSSRSTYTSTYKPTTTSNYTSTYMASYTSNDYGYSSNDYGGGDSGYSGDCGGDSGGGAD
jgi:hypothetical protein